MSSLLAEPPGRQGPGPMQAALVEALDLALAKRAAGVLPGERRASGRGTGTELAQVRPYQVGDDVRKIDAAASARTGIPHVRDHVPERTLTTWLLLDVSASMAFGTADRLKSDVAEGVGLVIGRLSVRRAGRIGLLTTGTSEPQQLPPRGGRPALVALQQGDREGRRRRRRRAARTRSPQGLRRIGRLARGHSLIVVVSDFREGATPEGERPEWARALGALSLVHDVLAVEIVDPREHELPDVGNMVLVDPETGQRVEIDSSSADLRRRFQAAELARRDELKRYLRRARARHVALSTDQDWLRELGRGLR